jgi:GLPGLI family protein
MKYSNGQPLAVQNPRPINRSRRMLLACILLASFAALPVLGQEGTISYDRIIKIDIELPPEMESMRDRIPTENTTQMELRFNGVESTWKASAEQDDDGRTRGFNRGGMRIMMSGGRDQNETWINHDEGLMTERRDFMGRTFLIKADQPTLAWKLTGEQSEFDGYVVHRATAVRDSSSIEAWFAPEIPVSVGPGPFGGLPGAILVLTIDEGKTTFTATEVLMGEIEEGSIAEPVEGREVTREEFDQIVEEKRKEMEAQFGNRRNGSRFIIRN